MREALLQGHCRPGLWALLSGEDRGPAQKRGWVGTGPGADPPAESPSSAQLRCQIWKPGLASAVLGPIVGGNLLGPEGEAPISSPRLRKRQRQQRHQAGAKNKK